MGQVVQPVQGQSVGADDAWRSQREDGAALRLISVYSALVRAPGSSSQACARKPLLGAVTPTTRSRISPCAASHACITALSTRQVALVSRSVRDTAPVRDKPSFGAGWMARAASP